MVPYLVYATSIESDEYVIRNGLTDEERAYVYFEPAEDFHAKAEALSGVRMCDGPTKQNLSNMLLEQQCASAQLRREAL